ncbi:hypothetical protein DSAG12_01518 [Promethearchaeum syntrophicum]|uniref:Uncharacterized protein n=1 Tax=Promethearchaeum syntrophicum TaxID=2594042 RepID=A0A5B9D9K0_9ARCH|nr:hypothetical protein [Candidatus Prometheoarchaeum syntrophicum]QEE15691.1 hypothetical protein DSAG12_01518 [Candidatus Prometheoarchaeum syntrophicum]
MVLNDLGKSLDSLIRKIRRLPEIDKDSISAVLQELQRALLILPPCNPYQYMLSWDFQLDSI